MLHPSQSNQFPLSTYITSHFHPLKIELSLGLSSCVCTRYVTFTSVAIACRKLNLGYISCWLQQLNINTISVVQSYPTLMLSEKTHVFVLFAKLSKTDTEREKDRVGIVAWRPTKFTFNFYFLSNSK
jgi:hypothetical protein